MNSAPIYYLRITYTATKFVKKNDSLVLDNKKKYRSADVVCIGNTLEILNDRYWNPNLLSRLEQENINKRGVEIKITTIHEELAYTGMTIKRFEREFPA
jgi:hypothetical protein|tara:strand:+ start:45 stop:341 length:297 start_codon:yes stop_codon:yes gene_type:complete